MSLAALLRSARDAMVRAVRGPPPPDDPPAVRSALEAFTQTLALYHFAGCPYCTRVRRALRQLGLEVEMRDIATERVHHDALMAGGGRSTVPCLRIDEGDETRWLYESGDIVQWLAAEAGAIRARG